MPCSVQRMIVLCAQGSGPQHAQSAVVQGQRPDNGRSGGHRLAPALIQASRPEQACASRCRRVAATRQPLPACRCCVMSAGAAPRCRRLRRADPAAFWMLVSRESRRGLESRLPSRWVLAADYLLSALVNLAVAAALTWVLTRPALPLQLGLLAAAVAWWLTGAAWASGRSTAGTLFGAWRVCVRGPRGTARRHARLRHPQAQLPRDRSVSCPCPRVGLWYEEPRWGHLAPAWRCMSTNLLELAYLICSLGLGLPISLALRLAGGCRQCVGELLAGTAAVQEVRVDAAAGEGGGEGHEE